MTNAHACRAASLSGALYVYPGIIVDAVLEQWDSEGMTGLLETSCNHTILGLRDRFMHRRDELALLVFVNEGTRYFPRRIESVDGSSLRIAFEEDTSRDYCWSRLCDSAECATCSGCPEEFTSELV